MPTDIDSAFSEFYALLTTLAAETAAAKQHRESIQQCLESKFELTSFFLSGSFGNGTNIRGYSDVDRFAVIPAENTPERLGALLRKVAIALRRRFPLTGIRVDTPAVYVPFGPDGSESTDVIPAVHEGKTHDGFRYFAIAGRKGSWVMAGPEAHNAFVARADEWHDGGTKQLIRYVKAWRYLRQVPISSFYLELRVASYALDRPSIYFPSDIFFVLDELWRDRLVAFRDPMGISGLIDACAFPGQRTEALRKLRIARAVAERALLLESKGRVKTAFLVWTRLFGKQFPSYR